MQENPFKPGVRVAVFDRHADTYYENFVDKVYKNGNFTLKGSTQQWRPHNGRRWATETGNVWNRPALKIWDADTDAEITAKIAAFARGQRFKKIQDRLRRMAPSAVTNDMLDQIEAALALVGTPGRAQ
jgi:hypothetical protein